jgi:hypothetical protein
MFEKWHTSNTLVAHEQEDEEIKIAPASIWRIYYSKAGRERALTYFLKKGYLYFVLWKNGDYYGMQATWRADWQKTGDAPSIQR